MIASRPDAGAPISAVHVCCDTNNHGITNISAPPDSFSNETVWVFLMALLAGVQTSIQNPFRQAEWQTPLQSAIYCY